MRVIKADKLLGRSLVSIWSLVNGAPVRLPAVLVMQDAGSFDGAPLHFTRVSGNSSRARISTLSVILITLDGSGVQRYVLAGAGRDGFLSVDGEAIEGNTENDLALGNTSLVPCSNGG